MDIPDHIKGRVVPSTVQLYGETFHREANLDEHFQKMWAVAEIAKVVYETADTDAWAALCDALDAVGLKPGS